jgi:cysteinyl-tRNA synthetase
MLSIFNSLTKKKEVFKPIVSGQVKLYVCGMTVYDFCHLGHARSMVSFDLMNRWFRESGFKVLYVRNITDIDDKIIAKSTEQGLSYQEITKKYIKEMNIDADALGIIRPDFEPKATDYIEDMISMIEILIEKGFAYIGENKDIFYSVEMFADYGKLSGKSLDDLRAGNRVKIVKAKKNSFDFVLWKAVKPNEPFWDSPWGKGRPGWHIECSAMSNKILGNHFDIHGGGQDLQFPHHENEIAQSEATHDCKMANYWVHNGFVKIDDEKMSKSLGNFSTIRSITDVVKPEVVRFFMLRAHYRSPLNYSFEQLSEAQKSLTTLYLSIRGADKEPSFKIDWSNPYAKNFKIGLDDDFNTPEALSVIFNLANEVNKNKVDYLYNQNLLISLSNILGILTMDPDEFLQGENNQSLDVDKLIKERNTAKKTKDFKAADKIRTLLLDNDIIIEDTPEGTTWRKK